MAKITQAEVSKQFAIANSKIWGRVLITISIVATLIPVVSGTYLYGTGFGTDSNKSVSIEEVINPKDGKIIKVRKETEQFQSGKTLWDWLSLAGTLAIPILVAILGYQFQRREQKRTEQQSNLEREIAEINSREEGIEAYIDRMSDILLDKQLSQKIKTLDFSDVKKTREKIEQDSELDTAINVARVRSSSILRRLSSDQERQARILYFLRDTELLKFIFIEAKLEKINLKESVLNDSNLSGANLRGANLSGANLRGANLDGVDFKATDLRGADFKAAELQGAELQGADLRGADLQGAYLCNASLNGADLQGAYLCNASLNGANFRGANLSGANLNSADLRDADFRGAYLTEIIWNEFTRWEDVQGLEAAINVPQALLKQKKTA
ncbi:pentapeptide repeat-containing protein (plasmid) [Nostoc sp. UHCC 0302]|uniref:pentapeptide repeat-containing protein n=1 Tax=Nostoc sp. UHCC 0302 TaxID=3134896 RepID=UPI00311CAF24